MKRLFVWLASVSICAAQAVSIGPFATEDWVDERLQVLTNDFATVQYVDDAVGEVEDKIPDVSGFATKAYVDAVSNAIPDVSGFATVEYVDAVSNSIPDVSGLATKSYVDAVSNAIPDVSGFATKAYVDAVSNAIPDVSTFSTVEYVNTTSNNLAILIDDLVSEEELGSSVSNIVPGWALVPVSPVTAEVDPAFTNWLATTNVVIDDNVGTFVSNMVPSWALVPIPPVTIEVDPAFTNWLATTNSATVQYVDDHKWDWSTQITNPPAFPTYSDTTLTLGSNEYDLAGFANYQGVTNVVKAITNLADRIVSGSNEAYVNSSGVYYKYPDGYTLPVTLSFNTDAEYVKVGSEMFPSNYTVVINAAVQGQMSHPIPAVLEGISTDGKWKLLTTNGSGYIYYVDGSSLYQIFRLEGLESNYFSITLDPDVEAPPIVPDPVVSLTRTRKYSSQKLATEYYVDSNVSLCAIPTILQEDNAVKLRWGSGVYREVYFPYYNDPSQFPQASQGAITTNENGSVNVARVSSNSVFGNDNFVFGNNNFVFGDNVTVFGGGNMVTNSSGAAVLGHSNHTVKDSDSSIVSGNGSNNLESSPNSIITGVGGTTARNSGSSFVLSGGGGSVNNSPNATFLAPTGTDVYNSQNIIIGGYHHNVVSNAPYSVVLGGITVVTNQYVFMWNGGYGQYADHGPGTFNIDPIGGTDGFWIGETNLQSLLTPVRVVDTNMVPILLITKEQQAAITATFKDTVGDNVSFVYNRDSPVPPGYLGYFIILGSTKMGNCWLDSSGYLSMRAGVKELVTILGYDPIAYFPYYYEYNGVKLAPFDEVRYMAKLLLESIAPVFSSSNSYTNGDFVVRETKLYECTNAVTAGDPWYGGDWRQTSVSEVLGNIRRILDAINGEAL